MSAALLIAAVVLFGLALFGFVIHNDDRWL